MRMSATVIAINNIFAGAASGNYLPGNGNHGQQSATLPALLLPVCSALDLLHASKCYHRDVAPDNIMLVEGGSRLTPVLLDFGAARKAIESTQVFTAILKPGYAPIEQYGDGELQQGPWTDIYALAGVVYFTLAGNAPPTAIARMLKDAMPRPRDAFVGQLPEHWLDAIECALAVKPELQPQTISEFVASFGWDTMGESMTTVVPPPIQSSPPPSPSPSLADDASTVVMPRRDLDARIASTSKSSRRTRICGCAWCSTRAVRWILVRPASRRSSTPASSPDRWRTWHNKPCA